MRKSLYVTSVAVLMASLMAGCSPQSEESGPSGTTVSDPKASAKEVKLTFSIWGNDLHKKMYEDLIQNYRKDHPHVSVEIMTIPASDYQQKISVMMASRTAPDVMWLMERAIPQFMNAGQLEDLSSITSDAGYKSDDLIPSTLELVKQGEKLFGIPFSTPPNMIYYNKSLFKDKGLKTPGELYAEGNWTYEEMTKAAAAIAQPDQGIYGLNLIRPGGWNTSWIESLQTVVWAYGADYFSKDGKQFTLNSQEGSEALQYFSDAMFKSKIHPKPGDQTVFESGKIAMQQELFSYIGKVKPVKDFEWDIAPMPEGPGGQGTTLGYATYSVTKGNANAEEAKEFVKFLSSPENMKITSQYFVPSRKSVLESDEFLKQGPSPESVKVAVLDQMEQARVRQGFQNFQQIDEKMKLNFDAIYTQEAPIPDILAKMEKDMRQVLDK